MVFWLKNNLKKILTTLGVFVALVFVLYLSLGFLITSFLDVEKIQSYVKKTTGLDIIIENPAIKTMPDLSLVIKANELKVGIKSENKVFFVASKPNLRARVLPFLLKKLSVAEFESDNIKINISRDKNSVFDFEKYLPKEVKTPLKLSFANTKVNVNKANVEFLDYKQSKKILLNSDNFRVFEYSDGKKINSNISALLKICDLNTDACNVSNLSLKSDLKLPLIKHIDEDKTYIDLSFGDFSLSSISPYVEEFSPVKFKKNSGNVSLDIKKNTGIYLANTKTKSIDIEFLYNGKKSNFLLEGISNGVFKAKFEDDKVLISDSSFVSDGINTEFSGEIKKYKTKKPVPNLDIKINNSDFLKLVQLIPAGFVVYKTDVINELIKARPYARVEGGLNISKNFTTPDVVGSLKIFDIYLFKKPVGFAPAVALCDFIGDKVKVDVRVDAPNSQYVKVKGVSELYGRQSGEYDIVSSENVNLAFAHKYLIPVQRVIGFKLGPLPFMKIDGSGKIHIVAKGTIYDAVVDGKFFGKNIKASLDGLNAPLSEGKIELDFKGKVINIVDTSAKIFDGMFLISGFADDYGNINIKSDVKNVSANSLLAAAKTSEIIKPRTGDLSKIKSATGKCDLTVILKGKAKSLEGLDFLDDILPVGNIVFKNVGAIIYPNIKMSSTNGQVVFDKDYKINLKTVYKNSPVTVNGTLTPNKPDLSDKNAKVKVDIVSNAEKMRYSDILEFVREQNYFDDKNLRFAINNLPLGAIDFIFNTKIAAKGTIPVQFSMKDLSKLSLDGSFVPLNSELSKNISFKGGTYKIEKQKIKVQNSNISVFNSNIYSNGTIENIFSKPQVNIALRAQSVPMSNLGGMSGYTNIAFFKSLLSDFTDYKGSVNLDVNIRKNVPKGHISFNNVSAYNSKQELSLVLKSGLIKFSGNKLLIDALNFSYGNTPLYFNAIVQNYLSKHPAFSATFTTNIDEVAADKLINPYLTYPLKVKGEIILKGKIKGGLNDYTLFSNLLLPKDADISYMGANLGDLNYDREFDAKIDFSKNIAKINSAKYQKYVTSQNNKPTPVTALRADGRVVSTSGKLNFENLHVVTPTALTARIFNVIFKKSVLKQGLFSCDLHLNGNILMPHATGEINFRDINIPLYNTKISDMDFDIKKDVIHAVFRGKTFDSDVDITADIKNKQTFPIVLNNLEIKSKKTSLSGLFEGISQIPRGSSDIVPDQPIVFKPQDLVVIKGSAFADVIEFKNIKATDLKASFSNPTGFEFNIDNIEFNIAGGKVVSKGNFDVVSLLFDIDSIVYDCDANLLTESFLGLKNQMFGRANAKINLSGKVPQTPEDIKFVNGRVEFSVNEGKMPKLGSLEYLLRAGNLIKSGLFGLTLNNLIEVLTPYKTGEFSTIRGNFKLASAKINSLEIFSKGKNLSLFIYGNYDIINDDADIEILGRLSKNVSNVLGRFGNASINSLFNVLTGNKIKEGAKKQIIDNVNKIPLIEISGDDYRLFLAKIKGKLNSDDYVKSFNWLN